nr:putative ribonuclease H-like domain-containing protein [Tanacetum cinerariifolium]
MELESIQSSTTAKLPLLKQENANSFKPTDETTTDDAGTSTTITPGPVTIEEKAKKKNDVKARKTRFGRNEATKKTQKTLLKQLYKKFSATSTESLVLIFNRLQKLVSQLAVLDVFFLHEDLNLKFLRSLPSEWNTHMVVWRNKLDLDKMSLDDLYNNFKIVEQEVRGTTSTNTSSQNMAFMSSPSPNSTNEVPADFRVSTASPQVSNANLSDAIVLDKLIGSQVADNSKKGFGYVSYNPVLPPHTRRFSPLRIDLSHTGLPEFAEPSVQSYRVKPIEVVTQKSSVKISAPVKENNGAPLIEDWESDKEDEVKSPPEKKRKIVEPSIDKRKMIVNETNHSRVNHNANTVPKAMLTRTGLKPVNSVRLVNPKRNFQRRASYNNKNFFKKVNTAKEKVNTARPNLAVLNAVRANKSKAIKASTCWVWRPIKLDSASIVLKNIPILMHEADLRNISFLTDFKEFDGGIMHKKYCLVITDDFSKFTWVFFLATKKETSRILKSFKTEIENLVDKKNHLGKFDGKSDEGFFVGYSINSKAFRVYNTRTRKVEENLHIKFLENKPLISGTTSNDFAGKGASFDTERPNAEHSTKDINTVGLSINTANSNFNTTGLTVNTVRLSDDFFGADNDMRRLDGSGVQTRRMIVTTDEQGFISDIYEEKTYEDLHTCLFARFLSQEEPKRITNALKDPAWVEVMQEELLQFNLQKVWTLVDLPRGKRASGTKWVFRNKKDERGIMDVKSDFLYGRIEKEFYVCHPTGFKDTDYPDKVYKVKKALYGLYQAPRAWYETLAKYLLDNGFCRGKIDQTLFIKKQKEDLLLVQVSMVRSLMYLTSSRPNIMFAFWCPTSARTLNNGEIELNATIDGQVKTITEASVRRHLKLADADGIPGPEQEEWVLRYLSPMFHQVLQIKPSLRRCMMDWGRATTTASSLAAEQGSGNISKTQTKETSSGPSSPRTSSEGGPGCHFTIEDNEVTHLENELTSTKAVYNKALIVLTKRVKKLEKKLKHKRRRAIIDSSSEEEASLDHEDSPKKGRMIEEIDKDENANLEKNSEQGEAHETTKHRMHLSTASQTDDDEILAKTLPNFKRKIKMLFDNTMERIRRFVPMESKGQAGEGSSKEGKSLKRSAEEELGQEQKRKIKKKDFKSQRRQGQKTEKLTLIEYVEVNSDSKEVINVIPLDVKYPIVNWKSYCKGDVGYYEIHKADGSYKTYIFFSEMLNDFDREDLIVLYKLFNEKYASTRPEFDDLILWGDMKIMFEPDGDDKIWKNHHSQELIE